MIPTPARAARPARPLFALACAAALGFTLSSCAQYAQLKEKSPPFQPPAGAPPGPATQTLAAAQKIEAHSPREAVGRYLDAAHRASLTLQSRPQDANALATYNYSLSRAFGALSKLKENPWAQPQTFPGAHHPWQLAARPDPRPQWKPELYQFLPADAFDITGKYVAQRAVKPGLGAPLIATSRPNANLPEDRFAQGRNIYYGATAVAHFKGNTCEITFKDPLESESIVWQGRRFPLAADFTAPLALALVSEKPKKMELARLLNPEKFANTARLARLQPYDPKKIPIICVHGLKDSPATWVPMVNALRADPFIRQHYQIWFFSYPSGYPYPYSASIFRQQLDAIKTQHPGHQDAVLIGHSMGGVISRTLITTSGQTLWNQMFTRPPEKAGLDRQSTQIMRDALIFRSRDDVSRAIFIAAPHRGSELASNWIGRLGSKLVRAPSTLIGISTQLKNVVTLDPDAVKFDRMPNSVDTLSPNNRFVRAINTLPVDPSIPYHSIIGDRGKGNSPNSSDGVVPYWSSHLDGAQSELIVPSSHGAHRHPQAIDEVRRILKTHLPQ